MVPECKPEWNKGAIMVFSRLPSLMAADNPCPQLQPPLVMNPCKGKEKFKEFKSIVMSILKPEETKELMNKGCFIPNCMQRSWKIRNQRNTDERKNDKPLTGFGIKMPPNMKVLVREEVNLYTLINFFAEVGGYLGLLLGESLISYLITASKWFQTLKTKFKVCCRNADEVSAPSPE